MNAQPDLWPLLRSALADTTRMHWSVLRMIASGSDPRLVAAESVATAALAYLQEPATWVAAQTMLASEQHDPEAAALITAASELQPGDLTRALRRLETLDVAARTWSEAAYAPPKKGRG